MDELIKFTEEKDEEHWISVSDLMAGLMIVFLFIAIVFIKDVFKDEDVKAAHESIKIKKLAIEFKEIEDTLYKKLLEEFEDDLEKWNAKLNRKDLSIKFEAPDVLFDKGEATLKKEFETILEEFFPRYLEKLAEFKDDISEVRIEGHTSSEWNVQVSEDEAYFKNMELSQSRTRAVLQFNLSLPNIRKYKAWAKQILTANGLSSSQLIKGENGLEDKEASRRVEFKIRTKSKERIVDIVDIAQ